MNDHSLLSERFLLPRRFLVMVMFVVLSVSALATWYELQLPWLGLTLKSTEDAILVIDSQSPAKEIPLGAQVLALVSKGKRTDLQSTDFLLDPDVVDDYSQLNDFFQRQTTLYAQLQYPVEVIWKVGDSSEKTTLIHPEKRSIQSLPFTFWLSLTIGATAFIIGCWIWVLRRNDWGTRMYAITGFMFFVTVVPIAIYTSRPIALSGAVFQVLSAINHLAVISFGMALIGLFLSYPHQIIKPRNFLWLPLVYGLCWLADVMQLAPNIDWGHRLPVISEFLLAVLISIIQWRNCRFKPVEKASLRCFLLFVLTACSLTILPFLNNVIFGYKYFISATSIIQHPTFALSALLIMYIGIAVGLGRYHLFDLDEWAYRILLWAGSAAIVILLDSSFVLLLNPDRSLSLGVTLVIAGLAYFPLRQWLWLRYVTPASATIEHAMPDIIRIAFVDSTLERERLWSELLHAIYNPLDMELLEAFVATTKLKENGLGMHVPSCGGLPARVMRYSHQGQRLFTKRDVVFVEALCQLMENAAVARISYEQGAAQERRRISRDMHDDVGARLLQLIHRAKDEATAEIARAAVRDLRTALNSFDAKPALLADALADWRLEIETRCDAANVMITWIEPDNLPEYWLSVIEKSALERVLREMISNALKHAFPTQIRVETKLTDAINITVSNDSSVNVKHHWLEGRGLRNMRVRLSEVGGTFEISHTESQSVLTLSLPFVRQLSMREALT